MSHKKAKDVRTDCIFRYKNSRGQLICSNYGYEVSEECIKRFGLNPFFNDHLRNNKIEYTGGIILGGDSVITKCRGCKYYCNDISKYISRVHELKIRLKRHSIY